MFKLASALVGLSALLAGTAAASSISGLGDPLNDPLLTAGIQQNFDGVTPGEFASLTTGNITLTGVNGTYTVGGDYNGYYNTTGGQSAYNNFDLQPSIFRMDFLSPVTSFAFNFGASDLDWLLQAFDSAGNLLDQMLIQPVLASNNGEYFGLSSSTPIVFAMLSQVLDDENEDDGENELSGDFVFIDRVTTNNSDVPVPAALPLLATGIAGVAAMRRRKKSGA